MYFDVFICTCMVPKSQLNLITRHWKTYKSLAQVPHRLQCLTLNIQQYDYKIVYKSGHEMVFADALSQLNLAPEAQIDLDTAIHVYAV